MRQVDEYFADKIRDHIALERYNLDRDIYNKRLKEYFIVYDVLYKIFCQRIEQENEYVIEVKFKETFLSRSLIITRRVSNDYVGRATEGYIGYFDDLVKISNISDKSIYVDYDFSFAAVEEHGAYDFVIQGLSQMIQLIFLYKNVEHGDDSDFLNDMKDLICHYVFMYSKIHNKYSHKYVHKSMPDEISVGFNDLSSYGHTLIEDIKIID